MHNIVNCMVWFVFGVCCVDALINVCMVSSVVWLGLFVFGVCRVGALINVCVVSSVVCFDLWWCLLC